MAELALTGLMNPALADYTRPTSSRADQSTPKTGSTNNRQAHVEREPETSENERVITGEVVDADDNTYQNINARQTRSNANTESSVYSESPRRFSMQAAIQTFRENEALVSNRNEPRQVSGIIDEYV